ncbi:hypothetical protein [Sphingopyxis macrogoltabida]|nr:hypothetical protein [Sphingopyxis macrogoltabida]
MMTADALQFPLASSEVEMPIGLALAFGVSRLRSTRTEIFE